MKYLSAIHSGITLVIVSSITLTVSACSAPKWVDSTLNKLPESIRPDGQTGQPVQTGQVFFAITAGLPVYAKSSASSKVLGRLARHEKVTRTRLEKGYAYVITENGRLEGWVENSRLDWRVPAKETPRKVPTDEAKSTPAQSESNQPEPPPERVTPPAQKPAVIAPSENPAPESTDNTTMPATETPLEQKAPVIIPEPALPVPKKPTPSVDSSKPAPSIFDSF